MKLTTTIALLAQSVTGEELITKADAKLFQLRVPALTLSTTPSIILTLEQFKIVNTRLELLLIDYGKEWTMGQETRTIWVDLSQPSGSETKWSITTIMVLLLMVAAEAPSSPSSVVAKRNWFLLQNPQFATTSSSPKSFVKTETFVKTEIAFMMRYCRHHQPVSAIKIGMVTTAIHSTAV